MKNKQVKRMMCNLFYGDYVQCKNGVFFLHCDKWDSLVEIGVISVKAAEVVK